MWLIIGLTVVGFALIILDLLFVPGSIFVVAGSVMVVYSIYLNFIEIGWLSGSVHLLLSLAAVPKLFFWSMERASLKEEMHAEDGYVGVDDRSGYIGQQGIARSDLRPSGVVRLQTEAGEVQLDCVAEGGYIDKGSRVLVVEDRGTSAVVRAVKTKQSDTSDS